MRVAAIDIGTNTVLLLVAEARQDGVLSAVEERATITRLGEGVDKSRRLLPAALERTNECLSTYAGAIRAAKVDRVAVVGTSAMRDAAGGEEVRRHVASILGVEVRVISGDEEARMTFSGAVSGLGLSPGGITVFDIGGGSTEVVHGRLDSHGAAAEIALARSFDVGSVRLTERHVFHDPPTEAELVELRCAASSLFADLAPSLSDEVVGIAGTMTTLAAVSLRMARYDGANVHGKVLRRTEVARLVSELAGQPLAERSKVPGLDPKRADVIVAGAIIALALLERLGAEAVRVSDRGVRWGLAEALAGKAQA